MNSGDEASVMMAFFSCSRMFLWKVNILTIILYRTRPNADFIQLDLSNDTCVRESELTKKNSESMPFRAMFILQSVQFYIQFNFIYTVPSHINSHFKVLHIVR